MGIIQKQSIQSALIISFGFAIGAINMIILAPKVLTTEEIGLTRIITDAGLTMATLCTLGSIPVINKFFPFYKSYLKPTQNDLPFLTLITCMGGFAIMCFAGYAMEDFIVRKFSGRSPLFVQYSYLIYPYALFMLLFIWLESFSWSFRRGVLSNSLRETLIRFFFTVLLTLVAFRLISLEQFFLSFSLQYMLPVIILLIVLRRNKEFQFNYHISSVTWKLKGKMISFGLFVFGAQFLNLLSRTIDTFLLSAKSARGLTDAAVFTIATYVVTLMEVPQRSLNSITIPVLAESWKNKDLNNIANIYKKSVSNLLIIGLIMFPVLWLNVKNLAAYLGKEFIGIETIVLFLGIGKLIDLGTGANSQIIGTSNFWKLDFTTNVIYTLLALPLNYFLIDKYGLMGAAYSSLISLTFYNLMRLGFIWVKFGLQPYTFKSFLVVAIAVVCTVLLYFLPQQESIFLDASIRSIGYLLIFVPLIFFTKISTEVNELILNILKRIRIIK